MTMNPEPPAAPTPILELTGVQVAAIFFPDVLPLFYDEKGKSPRPRLDLDWVVVADDDPVADLQIGDLISVHAGDRGEIALVGVEDIVDIVGPGEDPPMYGKWLSGTGSGGKVCSHDRKGAVVEVDCDLTAVETFLNVPPRGVMVKLERIMWMGIGNDPV